MLPSMPILFNRESQDAFGNKILPSTSFFHQDSLPKPVINPEPPPQTTADEISKPKETKAKTSIKQKDNPPRVNALEIALVRSYHTKVQSRLSNPSVPTNKFVQFKEIMKCFDPSKETPVHLYRKIEQLFGDEHQDILEEFLLFLKPGQAAEVGRFMDHFMLVQMSGFIQLLKNTFFRKPTVLRKILRALTTGINNDSYEDMKRRVLPHLRSKARLIHIFKSLFPDERPSDNLYEKGVEVMTESVLTNDNGCDMWQLEEEDNKRKPEAKEGLDTMYLHGRVFLQQGRLLRPARVTYPYSKEPYRVHARRLAPSHAHHSPPNSDVDRTTKRNKNTTKVTPKKPKRQHKSPTKNTKDVNDNNKHKDVLSSPKVKAKNKKVKDKTDIKDKKREKERNCKNDDKIKKEAPVSLIKEAKCNNWTRDEDKTMLQVLKVEADSDQVFMKVRELLPHRSSIEIKERFCHVMNLLQQMAVGDVT